MYMGPSANKRNIGPDMSAGMGPSTSAGMGMNMGQGMGMGPSTSAGMGMNMSQGMGMGPSTSAGMGMNMGQGMGMGPSKSAGMGMGMNMGSSMDMSPSTSAGIGMNMGPSTSAGMGMNKGPSMSMNTSEGMGINMGPSTGARGNGKQRSTPTSNFPESQSYSTNNGSPNVFQNPPNTSSSGVSNGSYSFATPASYQQSIFNDSTITQLHSGQYKPPPEVVAQALQHTKYAMSALHFDDVHTALHNIRISLGLLTGNL